jgi:hypothetical protein
MILNAIENAKQMKISKEFQQQYIRTGNGKVKPYVMLWILKNQENSSWRMPMFIPRILFKFCC